MGINENIKAWNQIKTKAEMDLATIEATLKADFNNYIDSLCAYLNRLKEANDERRLIYNSLQDHQEKNQFGAVAEPFIINQAEKYILDGRNPVNTAITTVNACDVSKLTSKKVN